MSASIRETSVRYRVLREVNDWMTVREIARMLERQENAVKGAISTMIARDELECRTGENGLNVYRVPQTALSRRILSMVWADTSFLEEALQEAGG